MQKNFWARVAAFIRQSHIRKSWRRVVSALTCVVVFCTTYALILPAITMEGTYSCGQEEHVHSEECRIINSQTELICSPAHSHGEACYGENGSLACGLADFVVHSHNEYCYAEDGTLRCVLLQVTEHSGDEGVYYVIEGSEGPNTTAHIHSDSCYIQVRGQQLCTLTEGEAHIHDAECYDVDQISCTLEEKEGHVHTGDCYTLIQSCADETHTHDDTCYYQELTCGQEEDGHTHTDACKQPALVCVLSTEPHAHTDSCYELLTETACGKLSLTRHDHTEACVHTETEEILLCEQEEHLHTLICYSDPTADLETAENWEAPLKDLELDGTTAENLLSVARTQLGYTESKLNYTVLEDGITQKGYTRYGAWSGTPYADWNELFLEFCLHYAGIEAKDFPRAEENKTWAETLSAHGLTYTTDGTPIPGDLIFLNIEDTDYTGIVTNVSEEYVTVILGDYKNEVRSETFTLSDEDILAYALLPELEEEQIVPEEVTGENEDVEPLHASIEAGMLSSEDETETASAVANVVTTENQLQPPVRRAVGFAMTRAAVLEMGEAHFIKTVNVFYKVGDVWVPITGNVTLEKGTELNYEVSYEIKQGTLSASENVITYKLPLDKVDMSKTGEVMDGGTVVGSYVIDDSGLMTITYDPAFAEKNQVKPITGTISFGAKIDDFQVNEDGSITIDTAEGESYTITLEDNTKTHHKLAVDKKAEAQTDDNGVYNGLIENTITVKSEKGTNQAYINLNDWMGNNTYYTDDDHQPITVQRVNKDGTSKTPVTISPGPEAGKGSFDLSLPPLGEGESYEITYWTKVSHLNQGDTSATNSVNVNATDDENVHQGSDWTDTKITFENDVIEKTYEVSEAGDTVTWTIKINADAANGLNGWTLTDSMAGQATSVTIIDADGTVIADNAQLPYTFNNTYTGIITVTYTTKMEYAIGESGISNTATITPPPTEIRPPYSDSETAPYPGGEYKPAEKELAGVVGEYEELKWKLTIGPNRQVINEELGDGTGWKVRDELTGEQYYSKEQQEAIKVAIDKMLDQIYGVDMIEGNDNVSNRDYNITFTQSYPDEAGEIGKKAFILEVYKSLPVLDKEYSIEYSSTPVIREDADSQQFINKLQLNGKTLDVESTTHTPLLVKRDGSWQTGVTWKDISGNNSRTVTWFIQLNVNDQLKQFLEQGENVVITEDVPDSLSLSKFVLQYNFPVDVNELEKLGNGHALTIEYAEYWVGDVKYPVNFTIRKVIDETGNLKYEIEIPNVVFRQGTYPNNPIILQEFRIQLDFDLPDDYAPSQYPNSEVNVMHDKFTNSATISVSGGDTLGKTEQTQIVTDPSITEGEDEESIEKILKYIGTPGTNELPYVIQVNHQAEDLSKNSDWLQVEDILTYQNPDNGNILADLIDQDYIDPNQQDDPDREKIVMISLYEKDASGELVPLVKEGKTYIRYPLEAFKEDKVDTNNLEFPGVYVESTNSSGSETVEKKIEFYIPDGYYAKLEYTYKFTGSGKATMNNVSKVSSYESEFQSDDKSEVTIKEAEVTANVQTLNILKVAAGNSNKRLAGAIYELYEYVEVQDSEGQKTGQWQFKAIVESDANGELKLTTKSDTEAQNEDVDVNTLIKAETAYYLVEIQAPEGYVLDETRHYFAVQDNSKTTTFDTMLKPDYFSDDFYYPDDAPIYITNTYNHTDVSVNKLWLDADGKTLNPGDRSIEVELKKYLTFDKPGEGYDYGKEVDVSLTVGKNSYLSNIKNISDLGAYLAPITRTIKDENGNILENQETDYIVIGDIIEITYKDIPLDPSSADETQLPGIMNMTNQDVNYHIPFTTVQGTTAGTWDYVFQLKVRNTTVLNGWVYELLTDRDNVVINVIPYDPTKPVTETEITDDGFPQTVTLSGEKWSETWPDLPIYQLDDHGRITGYYLYKFEEIEAPDGFVTDQNTDYKTNITTITNRKPGETDLTVKKEWPNGEPLDINSIAFELYQVTHTEKPDDELVEIKVQLQYYNQTPTWEKTLTVQKGSTIEYIVTDSTAVKLDGNDINPKWREQDPTTWKYTNAYEFEANDNSTLITYYNNDSIISEPSIDVVRKETGELYTTAEHPDGVYTLTSADGWTKHLTDLPLEAMVNGEHLYYSYYIQEKVPDDYAASYTVKYSGVSYEDGQYIPTYTFCPTVTQDGTELIISNEWEDTSKIKLRVHKKWINSQGDEVAAPLDVEEIQATLTRVQDTTSNVTINIDIDFPSASTVTVTDSTGAPCENYTVPKGSTVYLTVLSPYVQNGQQDQSAYGWNCPRFNSQSISDYLVNDDKAAIFSFKPDSDGVLEAEWGGYGADFWKSVIISHVAPSTEPIPITLTKDENWTWTSVWLEPGTYQISEVTEGYTVTYYVEGQETDTGTFEAGTTGEFEIHNQVDGTFISLEVEKAWNDLYGPMDSGDIPSKITFELHSVSNGEETLYDPFPSDPNVNYYTMVPNTDGTWKMTIDNLPQGEYTIKNEKVYATREGDEIDVTAYYSFNVENATIEGGTPKFKLTNTKEFTDIRVEKKWSASLTPEPVTLKLYRIANTTVPEKHNGAAGSFTQDQIPDLTNAFLIETVQVCVANPTGEKQTAKASWSWNQLPLTGIVNGETVYYSYFVVESTGKFIPSYSTDKPLTGGQLTITNNPAYVLPESGGPGTMMYTLGGLGLCGLAVLGYRPKRRRKEDPTS